MAQTIALKGDFIRKEVVATGTITPGQQVGFDGAVGGGVRKAFALENDLIGRSIDDNYSIGEVVQIGLFPPGAEVNALLAAGENAGLGAGLVGNGGYLEVASSGEDALIIAYATAAVNNASSVPARIVVEVA